MGSQAYTRHLRVAGNVAPGSITVQEPLPPSSYSNR